MLRVLANAPSGHHSSRWPLPFAVGFRIDEDKGAAPYKMLVAPIFAGLATEEESVTTVAGTAGAALRGTQVGNEVVEFTCTLGSGGA